MQLVFTDIGPIFIIVFAAKLVAEETGAGTIRAALAAPVYRWELYLAKAVTGLLYMIVLSAAALLFSVALAKIHYHFGAVGDSAGVVYSRNQAMQRALGELRVQLDTVNRPGNVRAPDLHRRSHSGSGRGGGHQHLVPH